MKGSQDARFYIAPKPRGYSCDHAEAAIDLAAGYGLVLDEWQQKVVRAWLRTTTTGKWCSGTWGVSVPRQNGKNGSLEAVELYMLVELGLKILHTSHLLTSARKAFKRLLQFFGQKVNDPNARFPELNAMVVEIRKTNGQEAIVLDNGGLIELGARTGGAGRGSSFDVLVIDEAQEYEEDEQEALKPTISAAPGGDPVTIFMGTPPRDLSERGEPFVRVRNNAVTGKNKRAAWVEHSARGDVDKMDETELAVFVRDLTNAADANPALGIRISMETIEDELNEFSPRSYARERLNMWPTPTEAGKKAFTKWLLRKIADPDPEWQIAAFGVDMNLERTKVSIGVATFSGVGVHLELAVDAPFDEAGVSALVAWIWDRTKRRIPVVIDAMSPARDILEVPLKKRNISVYILGPAEYTQACAMLHRGVEVEASVTHFDQQHLNESVKHTVQDPIKNRPGSFKWNKDSLEADLAPTVAITCAHYGSQKFARRRSARSERKPRGAIVA
ncbi:hypothetical protein SAMN04487917_101351 [Arthrobacter sp. yr096]|uniref:hypothetical protein n=1 Tax=Arthrobacter sp. yr096 TaxID=1761750 RepID=UPI0008B34FFD|nr:hypothetical protein [Arthrobacter sp. yr096]SEI44918.1 hypothetical protein SAMN04487917_101351 [Arthrobacter sp. yr096]